MKRPMLYVNDHRDYLKHEFAARIRRRPLYSQRAFARDLGLSSSTLTDYLKGRMRLSSGRVVQLGKSLGLSAEQKQHWIDLLESRFAKNGTDRNLSELRVKARLQAQNHSISLDEFKVISDWYHFGYLELLTLDNKKYSDVKKAASALGIPLKTMEQAVKRLKTLQFIRVDDKGIFQVDPSTQVGDQIPSEAIRRYHEQLMSKAQEALKTQPMDQRFNSSTVFALPQSQVPLIMERLKSLAFELLDPYLTTQQKNDALYGLNFQFFNVLNEGKSE